MTQRHRRLLILENDPQLRAELESNFRDLDVSSAGSAPVMRTAVCGPT